MVNSITVGLDLGTDKCCLTYQDKLGRPYIIYDNKNHKISSIIGILNDNILIGNDINKNNIYDIRIISNLKRLIGLSAESKEAIKISKYYNWTLENDKNDLIIIIDKNKYYLSNLFILLLKKIKTIIEINIGSNFNIIITIPINFNEHQKNIILFYCKQASLICKKLIYEPCAAALSYCNYVCKKNNKNNKENKEEEDKEKHILVFDYGAGTLDIAIVKSIYVDNNLFIDILHNMGDNNFGGIDIDILLNSYLCEYYNNYNFDKFFIENLKIKLCGMYGKTNSIIERYESQVIIISIPLFFELLNNNIKNNILLLLDNLHINFNKENIDDILLIGSSCNNLWIKDLLSTYYNKNINEYKINNIDFKEIAVSLGASCIIQNKSNNDIIINESLPLSIGIETENNIMCKILYKDTKIPCMEKYYFTTSENYQTEIEIKLYQGERHNTNDNFYLGTFKLDKIKPEIQGKDIIVISISVSIDGIIRVEGKVKNTDIENKIIINRNDIILNDNITNNNIKQYEINDIIFSNIMQKYYILTTMLNKLQYNLIDNVISNYNIDIKEIINLFFEDLLYIYYMLSSSLLFKNNIQQLRNIIINISNINIIEENNNIICTNDDIIIKLDNIINFLNNNLKHLVNTFQIRTNNIVIDLILNNVGNDHCNKPLLIKILDLCIDIDVDKINIISEKILNITDISYVNNLTEKINNINYDKNIKFENIIDEILNI